MASIGDCWWASVSQRERQGDLTQKKRGNYRPWAEPLEEEYWLALLQQGEYAMDIVNPLPAENSLRQETEVEQPADEETPPANGSETRKEQSPEPS